MLQFCEYPPTFVSHLGAVLTDNCLQILFCFVARGIALPAYKRGFLKWKHLPEPSNADDSGAIWQKWQISGWAHRSSFRNALLVFKPRVIRLVLQQLVSLAAQLASPVILQFLLELLEQPLENQSGVDRATMYVFAAALYATTAIGALTKHKYWYDASRVGIHWCAAQCVSILDTGIHRAADSEAAASTVNLANLVTVDAQRVQNTAAVPFGVWALMTTIVTNIFASVWLWRLLRWPGVAATGLCWMTPFIAKFISSYVRDTTTQLQSRRDERSNAAKSALGSILTLKTFTWSESWLQFVLHLRRIEHLALVRMLLASSLVTFVGRVLPSFASVTAFSLYVLVLHEPLLPSQAFSALVWYNMLYSSTAMLGHLLGTIAKVQASLARVEQYTASADTHVPVRHAPQLPLRAPSRVMHQYDPAKALLAVKGCAWGYPDASPQNSSQLDRHAEVPFQVCVPELHLPRTGLVVIFGPVGSGKSSLLLALAGELIKFRGELSGDHTCPKAYMQQPPWLGNISVEDNICLLAPFAQARYDDVCRAAQLGPVLQRISAAKDDSVGEAHASALSGGERSRVALARCLYSTAPAILLDDPLSALDAGTREKVWRNSILAASRSRCVVVAVSQLPSGCSVPDTAHVYEIASGIVSARSIEEASTFPFSMQPSPEAQVTHDGISSGGVVAPLVLAPAGCEAAAGNTAWAPVEESDSDDDGEPFEHSNLSVNGGSSAATVPLLSKQADTPGARRTLASSRAEKNARGGIKCAVIMEYLRSFIGLSAVALLLFSLLAQDVLQLGCSWLLASWTTNIQHQQNEGHGGGTNSSSHDASTSVAVNAFGAKFALLGLDNYTYSSLYAGGWGAWSIAQAAVLLLTSFGAAAAGTRLHNRMMQRLLHAPAAFFVDTPLGRLMNRAVADVQTVDSNIVWSLLWFFKNLQQVLLAVFTMAYTNPWTLLGLPPLALVYSWFAARYRVAARDMRRIGSSMRSPLLSQMHVLIDGGPVLRAARRTHQSLQRYMALLSNVTHASMSSWGLQQWITVSLELLAAVLILVTCLLAVQEHSRGGLAAAEIGFVLSFLLTLPQNLYWLVRNFTKVEIDMVAAERLVEYANVSNEAEWWQARPEVEADETPQSVVQVVTTCPLLTPHAALHFSNFSVTYDGHSLPALCIEQLHIPAGSKVAVVGPSGSGKTTLARALFGFVKHSGSIKLGDSDLSSLPLKDIRSSVGGLLQDSSIWPGTVLDNLYALPAASDTSGLALCNCCGGNGMAATPPRGAREYTSKQLADARAAVVAAGLWNDLLGVLPEGLHGRLEADGAPLSAGQRQLLLLARLQLHHRPIVVIDEASSHADDETEQVIVNNTLASASTVLFIAHRTRHLHRFDWVLALEAGRMRAFAPASEYTAAHS